MSSAPAAVVVTTLRRGDAGDLSAVAELMAAAFDPAYGEAWTAAQCAGMMTLPGVWLTLAERGGTLAGFALLRAIAGDAELLLLAVHPDARRRGVAAALVRASVHDARDRGGERLHLEVRDGNPAATLYVGAGFAAVGRRRGYYRGPRGAAYDAVTYSRPL